MSEGPKKNPGRGQGDLQTLPAQHAPAHPLSLAHRHALLALWLGLLALVLMAAGFWLAHYLESPEAHERARQFVIARIESATGAQVSLEKVGWALHRLEFELDGLRIRGKEPASEPALLQVDRVTARLKSSDLLAGHLAVRTLLVMHPQIHVVVYQDGSTNLPEMKARQNRPTLQVAMDEAQIVDGLVDWNDHPIRMDGVASNIFLQAVHDAADGHYDCDARVGQVRMQTPQTEPLLLSADAQFRLYRDRVEVPRLRVNERGWVLQATGEATDMNSPVVRLSYRASGDAAELARLLRYRELRRGTLQFSGQATYRAASDEYASAGRAQASDVWWSNETLRLDHVSGGFAFSVEGHRGSGRAPAAARLNIPTLFVTALGGSVHGKLETTLAPEKDQSGRADLKIAGVDLQRALQAFASRELPLERLLLAGRTQGALEVSWHGRPQNAVIDTDLQVSPAARDGRLPLTAAVQATVDLKSDVAQLRNLEAHTDRSSLSAQGLLAANSNLKVDLRTADVSELMPLVTSLRGGNAQLPVEFGGPAAFQGTVQGRLQSPALAGHLELHDLAAILRLPAKFGTGAAASERVTRTHWDSLTGDVRYAPSGASLHNGLLLRGNTRVGVDATVALANGSYNEDLPIAATLRLQNIQVAELQELLGSTYPITGQVNAALQLNGTARALNGSGRVVLTGGMAWRQNIRSASADIAVSPTQAAQASQLRLRNIVVNSDAGQLTGDAQMNLANREFAFDLKGSRVMLDKLRPVTDRNLPINGVAAFEARGQGTPSAPVINGQLSLRNLSYNSHFLGAIDVQAVTHGAAMNLTARTNFKDAQVTLNGEVLLRGAMPMHVTGELNSTKLSSLLQTYIPVRLDQPSLLQMHLKASGEAMHPSDITATLEVPTLAASYGGIAISNDGLIRMTIEQQVLRIDQFRIIGEGGSRFLRAQGQVELARARRVNLRVDGSVNLKLLQTVNPNVMAGGAANLNLQVNGTVDRPAMRGQLNIQNGSFAYIDFPNGLSDINGSMYFNEDRLQLQELTARTGGGLLHCTGFLTYTPAQGLGFNLEAKGSDIRLRYPEGLSSTADAELTLSGTTKNTVLSGEVTITRLGLNPHFDFASYLAKGIRGAPAVRIESPLNTFHLDVHILSTPELQVQTSMARLSGNVDLRLRGTAFRPVALGRVNLLEGELEFNGTKYRVERGDLTFTNPVRIAPTLDMELSTRVRDYDITLGFHGPIEKLTTTYRSDPPLSSSDIISLLAMGVTAEEQANPAMLGTSSYQATSVTESASNAILGQALNATVGSRVQKLFGVSRVKIDPNVGGGAVNTGLARVTVEQRVSNNLTLTYISNLSQSAQEVIQFEYNLNKNVRVVGTRDETGVVSFDVLFRKRKK